MHLKTVIWYICILRFQKFRATIQLSNLEKKVRFADLLSPCWKVEHAVSENKVHSKLDSDKDAAPSLVIFTNKEHDIELIKIVGDTAVLDLTTQNLAEALLVLAACYYVYDVEYPRGYINQLGLLQDLVFDHKVSQTTSTAFKESLNTIKSTIAKEWADYTV